MREHNRDRLRKILDEIGRQGWEIVLMTEIRADEKGGSVAGGRRGEGCGDPLRKSRYCPSGTSSGGVDRRGPEEVVRGEGCDGSFGGDEVGIGVPTHLGNR